MSTWKLKPETQLIVWTSETVCTFHISLNSLVNWIFFSITDPSLSTYYRLLYITIICFVVRCRYYFTFIIGEMMMCIKQSIHVCYTVYTHTCTFHYNIHWTTCTCTVVHVQWYMYSNYMYSITNIHLSHSYYISTYMYSIIIHFDSSCAQYSSIHCFHMFLREVIIII